MLVQMCCSVTWMIGRCRDDEAVHGQGRYCEGRLVGADLVNVVYDKEWAGLLMLFHDVGMERKDCNLFLISQVCLSDRGMSDEEKMKGGHTSKLVKCTTRRRLSSMKICDTDAE